MYAVYSLQLKKSLLNLRLGLGCSKLSFDRYAGPMQVLCGVQFDPYFCLFCFELSGTPNK